MSTAQMAVKPVGVCHKTNVHHVLPHLGYNMVTGLRPGQSLSQRRHQWMQYIFRYRRRLALKISISQPVTPIKWYFGTGHLASHATDSACPGNVGAEAQQPGTEGRGEGGPDITVRTCITVPRQHPCRAAWLREHDKGLPHGYAGSTFKQRPHRVR
jgi:hypothetical protein